MILQWPIRWQMFGMFDRAFDRGDPKTPPEKVVKW
jgi:hypothetical protein